MPMSHEASILMASLRNADKEVAEAPLINVVEVKNATVLSVRRTSDESITHLKLAYPDEQTGQRIHYQISSPYSTNQGGEITVSSSEYKASCSLERGGENDTLFITNLDGKNTKMKFFIPHSILRDLSFDQEQYLRQERNVLILCLAGFCGLAAVANGATVLAALAIVATGLLIVAGLKLYAKLSDNDGLPTIPSIIEPTVEEGHSSEDQQPGVALASC